MQTDKSRFDFKVPSYKRKTFSFSKRSILVFLIIVSLSVIFLFREQIYKSFNAIKNEQKSTISLNAVDNQLNSDSNISVRKNKPPNIKPHVQLIVSCNPEKWEEIFFNSFNHYNSSESLIRYQKITINLTITNKSSDISSDLLVTNCVYTIQAEMYSKKINYFSNILGVSGFTEEQNIIELSKELGILLKRSL